MNWLTSKSPEEVQHLLQADRKIAPEFRRLFKERKKNTLKECIKALHEKQHASEAACAKQLRIKENLTKDIIQYGLWKSKMIYIAEGVAKERSKTAKLRTMKIQFNFRKWVLDQRSYHHKELFLFSKNRQQYAVEELMDNLVKLINEEKVISGLANEGRESLVGKAIMHRWRDKSGVEQWYFGEVLSKVAGTNEWYNVRYEGEDDVLYNT